MSKQEETAIRKNEAREAAEAITIIKRCNGKSDVERAFILGLFRGMEIGAEADTIAAHALA